MCLDPPSPCNPTFPPPHQVAHLVLLVGLYLAPTPLQGEHQLLAEWNSARSGDTLRDAVLRTGVKNAARTGAAIRAVGVDTWVCVGCGLRTRRARLTRCGLLYCPGCRRCCEWAPRSALLCWCSNGTHGWIAHTHVRHKDFM